MNPHLRERITMLYTIAVILLIAWLLGIVGTYTIGAFVHVLFVVAVVLFVIGLLSGRVAGLAAWNRAP
jgi:asparagine N-glycosylation enzyme membrane subunit Stt3